MKARLYTLILFFFLISVTPGNTQPAAVTVTNYYDFEFSSRINRFHRSYTAFEYYAPVFTDVYWYDPSPYAWGTSIYGGMFSGGAYSYSYPSYGYYNDWYYPEYSGSYYWGYAPVYYNWYSPVVVNVNIYNGWHDNYYYPGNYYSRNVYNVYNNNNYYSSPRRTYTRTSSTNITRKESSPVSVTDVKDSRRNPISNEARRNIYGNPAPDPGDNRTRNRSVNNGNQNTGGNHNSNQDNGDSNNGNNNGTGNNNGNNTQPGNGTPNGNTGDNGNQYGNNDNRGTRANPNAPGVRRSADRNNVPEKAGNNGGSKEASSGAYNGGVRSQNRSQGTGSQSVRNSGNQSRTSSGNQAARSSAPQKSSATSSRSQDTKSSSSTNSKPARRK